MAIDLNRLTPEQLDRFLHMQSIAWRQKVEGARVVALREYYDGEHPVLLSDRQKEYIGKGLTEGEFAFAHNTVKSVIDTLRERMSVSGFAVNGARLDADEGDEEDDADALEAAKLMWEWWEANRLDAQQIRLHRRALRDGKSYVMVSYDAENQRPRITLRQVDDGTTGITYHRDPETLERGLFANNHWYTFNPLEPGKTGIQRKTTYLPDQIRKYAMGRAGQWEPVLDAGDGVWPLPWVDGDGKPLGILAVEFENPGGSEVAQIIGLQNALNKTWLDLLAAADAAGFPILVVENELDGAFPADANVVDDDDIDGADEFHVAPGRAISVDGAHVHRIDPADLSQLIDTVHLITETIAGISRTPQYYLRPAGGDVPSGEALKQLESGLVARAVERHLIFGQSWADVMVMAYKVAQTYGPPIPKLPDLRVETLWDSAETRQDLSEAQAAEILQRIGVPDEEIWQYLGYSAEKIAGWKRTQRSEQAAQVATIARELRTQQGATGTQANGNEAQ